MKYCPLCIAEYREGVEKCATCQAALVFSLHAEEVRANPPRLLWIGGSRAEFDAVAGALYEANIPALAEEGPAKVLQRFLRSESQICVLQNDFPRALAVAVQAIASVREDRRSEQSCHECAEVCSEALTVCPRCGATLILERGPNAESPPGEPVLPVGRYCPVCHTKYGENYTDCTVCGVPLVPEEMRGRPLRDEELKEKIVMVWRGGDPVAVSHVVSVLRGAGIRHHVKFSHDFLAFGLAMPRPQYMVWVLQSDAENAKGLLAGISDSPFFGAEISPDFPKEIIPAVRQVEGRWNPAVAVVEIWKGDDAGLARLLEDCLRENEIRFRREGRELGTLRLLVTKQEEGRAKEIVSEVRDGTSPL